MAPNIIDFIITAVSLKLAAAQIPVQHYSNTRWSPPQYQESYSNYHYQDQLSPPPRYSDPAYIYQYPEPYTTPVNYQSTPNSSPYTSYASSYAQPSAAPPASTLTKPNLQTPPPLSSSTVSSPTPVYSQGMAPPYSTSTQTTSYANPINPNSGQPAPSMSTSSVGTASKTSNSPVSPTDSSKLLPISNSLLKSLQTSSTNRTAVKTGSNDVDSTVLNNLAIALQLLIVNNILKSPASGEGESALSALNLETESPIPFPPSPISFNHPSSPTQAPNAQTQSLSHIQPYQTQNTFESSMTGLNGYPTPAMTNANFLGSSNLLSPGSSMMGSSFTPQHKSTSNFRLMSPYEALTSSSSSEMISSPFGSSSNFQSPYAALLSSDNNRDLFSINDFY